MADDDQKLKAARERMSRLREEAKDVEIARIQHAIKVLQKQRNELRLARFRKRGCQEESLAASTLDPLVAQRVAEPFTPRKHGAKHERSGPEGHCGGLPPQRRMGDKLDDGAAGQGTLLRHLCGHT